MNSPITLHRRMIAVLAAALMVSACQPTDLEKAPDIAAANPITVGQISVTSLDAPAPVVPETATVTAPDPVAAPVAEPPPKSAAQIACEKGRGNWITAGKTGTMACQTPLRDGGSQCSRDRDCAGQCLARSRTCAPYAPLLGCHEVLQDNGQRVTLCID